jgi:hypothetical protein
MINFGFSSARNRREKQNDGYQQRCSRIRICFSPQPGCPRTFQTLPDLPEADLILLKSEQAGIPTVARRICKLASLPGITREADGPASAR